MQRLLALAALTALVACESAIPPSRTTSDLNAANFEFNRLSNVTTPGTPPTGNATFSGLIGGPMQVDGESGYDFLGDLNLSVDFVLGDVDGAISDITLYEENIPDQNLGGTLAVTGTYTSALNATASGTLTAVDQVGPFGGSGSTNITMTLSGVLVNDNGTNKLRGSAIGNGSGDYEVFLEGGVDFFADQQ